MTQLAPLTPPSPDHCYRLYQQLCYLSVAARPNPSLGQRGQLTGVAAPPDTLATHPSPDAVLNLALHLLEVGDFQTRWQVAKLLPEMGTVAIAPLVQRLASFAFAEDDEADWDLPWFIARILGDLKHPAAAVALVNLLATNPQADVASMAALALANMGTIVLPRLAELLRSPATRRYAVQALAHLQTPAAGDLLMQVVNDPDPDIRATAIDALSRLPVANLAPLLLTALHDPDERVQRVAVIAAGLQATQLPEEPLVAALQTHLVTGASDVAQQAAIALGRLGTPAAVEALTIGLFQPLPLARSLTIVRELTRIASEPALTALATYLFEGPPLFEGLPTAPLRPLDVIAVSQEIARLLGQVETATAKAHAAAILMRLLTTTDHPTRQLPYDPEMLPVIALSLAHLGHTPAIGPLRQYLDRTNDRCRLHLLSALKQLDTTPIYSPAS